MALVHSSVIVTTTVVDTRTRDQLSVVLAARPQAMTFYFRFVELGSINKGTNQKIMFLGSSTTFLQIISDGTNYRAQINNGFSATVSSTLAVAPVVGDRVELLLTLTAAGVIQLSQSINEGAVSTAAAGSARYLPTAWGNTTLWINSFATSNVGLNAFRNIEIVAGVKTLQEMRIRAGTD